MNGRELLEAGKRLLSGKLPGEAGAEARELLFAAKGWRLSDYALRLGEDVTPACAEAYLSMAKRRAAGEPLQYITGLAPFFGYEFKVDRRVLIPRFDTEILVFEALRRIAPGMRILDICTGSGCIPITLALESSESGCGFGEAGGRSENPSHRGGDPPETGLAKKQTSVRGQVSSIYIEGADISADALAVARENAGRFGLGMRFFQSDLLDSAGTEYSMITANPPYITEEEMQTLDPEVSAYEPRLALFGGRDGLDLYRRIVSEAPAHLEPGGWLLMEIGCGQAKAVEALCGGAGFLEITSVKDLAGRDRVVIARWK